MNQIPIYNGKWFIIKKYSKKKPGSVHVLLLFFSSNYSFHFHVIRDRHILEMKSKITCILQFEMNDNTFFFKQLRLSV